MRFGRQQIGAQEGHVSDWHGEREREKSCFSWNWTNLSLASKTNRWGRGADITLKGYSGHGEQLTGTRGEDLTRKGQKLGSTQSRAFSGNRVTINGHFKVQRHLVKWCSTMSRAPVVKVCGFHPRRRKSIFAFYLRLKIDETPLYSVKNDFSKKRKTFSLAGDRTHNVLPPCASSHCAIWQNYQNG